MAFELSHSTHFYNCGKKELEGIIIYNATGTFNTVIYLYIYIHIHRNYFIMNKSRSLSADYIRALALRRFVTILKLIYLLSTAVSDVVSPL